MLVLSRTKEESIQIGDDIVIMVTGIRGNKVRLGIVAPRGVRVARGELLMRSPDVTPPGLSSEDREPQR
jgi:carbon storage regulator